VWPTTGIAPGTIGGGMRELDKAEPLATDWVRREGAVRKTLVTSNPGLLGAFGAGAPDRAGRRNVALAPDLPESAPPRGRAGDAEPSG